ncbi:MAG: hypothetical protein AAGD00_00575 [Planctomycetota bacterium]
MTNHPSPPIQPAPAPEPGTLPQPLTFFLTVDERRAVLRALRRMHTDRRRGLLVALRISPAERDA